MSTLNIHHLGLAVKHLDATAHFFVQVLGFRIVREVPDYPARFISNGKSFLTLWQTDPDAADFNRRKAVGLHHFALAVDSEQALNEIFDKARLFQGVRVDFSPEALGTGGARHCMLFEPGGIRLELIWPE
jgi:catechol 2,3-dioxygenase-like lactoylglutathione lyase family enzyme